MNLLPNRTTRLGPGHMRGAIVMMTALVVVIGLLSWLKVACAKDDLPATPSFDCDKVQSPVLRLVCDDTELSRLSGLLGRAYQEKLNAMPVSDRERLVAEHKAWIASRRERCPTTGPEAPLRETVPARLCLTEQYLQRLDQLGRPVATATLPQAAEAATFIHPHCVQLLGETLLDLDQPLSGEGSIDLTLCNRIYRHVPVTHDGGWWEADRVLQPLGQRSLGPDFHYKVTGARDDGALILEAHWGLNGTGYDHDDILILRRTMGGDAAPQWATARILIEGGSWSRGGIEDARFVESRWLDVDRVVTGGDLLRQSLPSRAERLDSHPSLGDLVLELDGRFARVGAITERYDLTGKRVAVLSATLEAFLDQPYRSPGGKCFGRVFGIAPRMKPKTLTPPELEERARRFENECLINP